MSFVMKYKNEIFGIQDHKEDFIPFNLIRQKSSTSKVWDEGGSGELT